MSLPIILAPLASLMLYLLYSYLVHPLFLSPLRRIPSAFPGSSFTSLWISRYRRNGLQALPLITRAHALHGPIIRIGPTEISVNDYESAKKIYIEKGGFAKPKWWAELFMTYNVSNMVSMVGGVGSTQHAARKRDMGNIYAKSFLVGSEGLREVTKTVLKNLERKVYDVANEGGILEVYNFNGAAHADIISAYLYGTRLGTRFLQDQKSRDEYYAYHDEWLKDRPEAKQAKSWIERFGANKMRSTETSFKEGNDMGGALAYRQLFRRAIKDDELSSELLDHFVAGAEGPRTTLTYLEWELSKRPVLQERLRDELRSVHIMSDVGPDFKKLDALPLLDAVLLETLRVHSPTPGPQHRVTPPEGTTLHGFFIPGGVQISVCLSILHRNANVFPDPDEWDPDRWLNNDDAKIEEMKRWFWPFGKGSRICIGKDFALLVMKSFVATIYSTFETEVVEDHGMEQEDLVMAGPVGEKLVLRFKVVG